MPIPSTHAPAAPQPAAADARDPRVGMFLGAILLIAACISAGVLAAHRLIGFAIPGCGAGGECDKLSKGQWGSVPFLYWPVSYLGLAYFVGMLAAWVALRGQATPAFRWMARLGALASIMFLGVMLSEKTLCPYCLGAHMANLGFWIACELSNRGLVDRSPVRFAVPIAAAGFFTVSAVLGMAEVRMTEQNARDRASAEARMAATLTRPPAPTPAATGPTSPPAPKPTEAPKTEARVIAASQDPSKGFTGRYRLGPENAPIRIVMITDYGCPDCRHFEGQAMQLLAKYPKLVSLSTKHFPFCTQCNPTPNTPDLHPNSCMAARAAEAAGMVYGPDGFWKMHRWLFENKGAFKDEDFNASLVSLGFDPGQLLPVMMSMQTLANVQADIKEANGLGLRSTPMMFVNGVELTGWASDASALASAVDRLAAQAPAPQPAAADQPRNAAQKLAEEAAQVIDTWRDTKKTPAMAWPNRKQAWTTVPETAPIKISLWGDLLEPNCAIADKTIRDAIAGRGDIRYEFRSFPFDQACNPELPRTMFPNGCRAARAEEAAGQLALAAGRKRMQDWAAAHTDQLTVDGLGAVAQGMGLDPEQLKARIQVPGPGDMATKAAEAAGELAGIDAYWRVHIWIIEHQKEFSDAALKAAAPGVGLKGDELIQRMNAQDIAETVAWDINIGGRIHIPEIPRVFVNGKLISRPLLKDQFIIERIIAEAEKPPIKAP